MTKTRSPSICKTGQRLSYYQLKFNDGQSSSIRRKSLSRAKVGVKTFGAQKYMCQNVSAPKNRALKCLIIKPSTSETSNPGKRRLVVQHLKSFIYQIFLFNLNIRLTLHYMAQLMYTKFGKDLRFDEKVKTRLNSF